MEFLPQDILIYISQFLTRCSRWCFTKTCKHINLSVRPLTVTLDLRHNVRLLDKDSGSYMVDKIRCSLGRRNKLHELYNLGEWISSNNTIIKDMILCAKKIRLGSCSVINTDFYCEDLIIIFSQKIDIKICTIKTLVLERSTLMHAVNAEQVIIIGPYNKPVTIPIHPNTKQVIKLDNSVTLYQV